MFNTQLPPTDDVLIREALLLSIDREQISSIVFGSHSPPAADILTGNMPDYPHALRFPDFNPEAAAALLDQAGWLIDPQTKLRSNAGENLTLHIVSPPWGMNPEVSQLMRAAWEKSGITVEIEIVPGWGQLKEAQTSGEYNAIGIHFFSTDSHLLHLSTAAQLPTTGQVIPTQTSMIGFSLPVSCSQVRTLRIHC